MRDSIIQDVEQRREELARRFDYDVKKIAAYLRERGQSNRKKNQTEREAKEHARQHDSDRGVDT